MFRRFMIVYWVLFAVTTVSYLFGVLSHNYLMSNFLDIRRPQMVENQVDSPYHIRVGLLSFVNAFHEDPRTPPWERYWLATNLLDPETQAVSRSRTEVLMDLFVDSNYDPDARKPWEDDPLVSDIVSIKQLDDQELMTALKEAKENYLSALEISKKVNGLRNWNRFFGSLALVILLWNVLWHTGHWVWKGRKAQGRAQNE